ncbi:MAG TPA: acetyl-CoA carboxylase biotin carboxyl carrier protein subunit [Gemmatimonadales bacterium]|nr:acetyl-CoA carboxylase biotin carboxyl carrier protein subunit [Gemmatimonadales bacterium]
MKYVVTVGGREFSVEIEGELVRLDGHEVEADLRRCGDTPEHHVQVGARRRKIAVDQHGEDSWTIVLDGTVHDVGILDERTRHIRSLTGTSAATSGSAAVKAPMPGLLVKRLVAVGDTVSAGQGLVVLEAMKMENELRAPIAGRVAALHGAPGESIDKGQLLVELVQPE